MNLFLQRIWCFAADQSVDDGVAFAYHIDGLQRMKCGAPAQPERHNTGGMAI
jgi:hypothetical protein